MHTITRKIELNLCTEGLADEEQKAQWNLLYHINDNLYKVQGKGSISNTEAEEKVRSIYDTFNAKRKQFDAQMADAEDVKMLEDLEKSIIEKQKGN